MKKTHLLTAVLAAATLTSSSVEAAGYKCNVIKNGVGMIKAGKADCAFTRADGTKGSCAGHNQANDANAWIYTPNQGDCAKINAGDFSGKLAKFKKKVNT